MSATAAAYDASGAAWRSRPADVYRRLAAALIDRAGPVSGLRVLDVGSGTGVAAEVALARGAALVVATDLAAGMLRHRAVPVPAAVADAVRLPFPEGSFDLVVLNFVLGHLDDPGAGLAEARRVGGTVLASGFDLSWGHPAKAAVDEVMASYGFELPAWYVGIKAGEDLVADPDSLAGLATGAGFERVEVRRIDVDVDLATAADQVAWRWGMAHLAPYLGTLEEDVRRRAWADCLRAVDGFGPVVVPMLALSAS